MRARSVATSYQLSVLVSSREDRGAETNSAARFDQHTCLSAQHARTRRPRPRIWGAERKHASELNATFCIADVRLSRDSRVLLLRATPGGFVPSVRRATATRTHGVSDRCRDPPQMRAVASGKALSLAADVRRFGDASDLAAISQTGTTRIDLPMTDVVSHREIVASPLTKSFPAVSRSKRALLGGSPRSV